MSSCPKWAADDVQHAEQLLRMLEQERGLVPKSIDLIPIIETARGVYHAYDIAAGNACATSGVWCWRLYPRYWRALVTA